MRLAFIQCPAWGTQTPPLALAYMAGAMRAAGHHVMARDLNREFYDEADAELRDYWEVDRRTFWMLRELFEGSELRRHFLLKAERWISEILAYQPAMIGFTIYHTSKLASLALANLIKQRQPEIVIVFGGPDCQRFHSAAELVAESAVDGVVIGEGEVTLQEVIERFVSNDNRAVPGALLKVNDGIVDGGDRPPVIDLDRIPFPDFSDLHLDRYQPGLLPILGSRGCVGRCVICNERRYWQPFRNRSAASIVAEMEAHYANYGVDKFHFNDSLINGNFKQLKELCRLLIDRQHHFQWSGAARACSEMTKDLLQTMKQAGCLSLSIGIESGSQRVINLMQKGFKVSQAVALFKHAHEIGMKLSFNLIVGFPGETTSDFFQTLKFLWDIRNYDADLEVLSTCLVSEGSELAANPQRFQVRYDDDLYWQSLDGANTFPKRLRKLRVVYTVARLFGLKTRFRNMPKVQQNWELAQFYRRTQQYRKAVRHFLRVYQRSQPSPQLLAALADCYRLIGEGAKASAYLAKGLALDPKHEELLRVQRDLVHVNL